MVSIIALIIIALAISFAVKSKDYIYNKPHTNGRYMGLGMLIGVVITILISILTAWITRRTYEFFAFSPAIGVALGAGIGSSLEKKYGKPIELTDKQKKSQWILTLVALGLLILGIIVLVITSLLVK